MKNSDIKVTGTPKTYGDGATRNSKEGKGRFDLIPPEPFHLILDRLTYLRVCCLKVCVNPVMIWKMAFNDENYVDTIISLLSFFGEKTKFDETYVSIDQAYDNIWNMLFKLAVHFQKGAEIFGEHNCEKGIPAWSFRDSGLRHMNQFFNNETDEPHLVSAVWNFWMLLWTIHKEEEQTEKFNKFSKEELLQTMNKMSRYGE